MDDKGLDGVAWCVQLHQKGEKSVRQVVWQLIEGSKLLADCRLQGAET
jgi:SOS response associated peptidase (SRAP)